MPSVSLPQLYGSLYTFVMQTLPDDCESRLANLLFMMRGIFLAKSVQLDHIACKLPSRAKKLSSVKRLRRFLGQTHIESQFLRMSHYDLQIPKILGVFYRPCQSHFEMYSSNVSD